jgi:hypothetical protein
MNHAVLLGDSIFDNAVYVPGGPPVIEQLRAALGRDWQATLSAVDGHVVADVAGQLTRLPTDATHLVISAGGNDALGHFGLLDEPAQSSAEVLGRLAEVYAEFRLAYREMLDEVLLRDLPMAVCTVYDAIPGLPPPAVAALSIFNDVILRETFARRLPVIDLRLVCTRDADYSPLSPIEPSVAGGDRIATAVARLLKDHDFAERKSSVYF